MESKKEAVDSKHLHVLKNGETADLLRFTTYVKAPCQTSSKPLAAHALADWGSSDNWISPRFLKEIYEARMRPPEERTGWMQVHTVGKHTADLRRRRVQLEFAIGKTYKQTMWFTVFDVGEYDIILGKPWAKRHNRQHEIDHDNNVMWIEDEAGRHTLVGMAAEKRRRALDLGLQVISWQEIQKSRRREKLQFFLARGENAAATEYKELEGLEEEMRKAFPQTFEPPTGLPPRRSYDLRIRLEPGAKPPYCNPYRTTPLEDAEMQRQLQLLTDDGWIVDSMSPFAAPILFVKKKDGSLRLCVDYRPLNGITLKDRFPLPNMDDLLNELHGDKWFTKLDLKSGYHQMRLSLEDREKTAFTTKYGLFEWTVVPFGLANAPSAFMRTMTKLLAKHRKYCVVYLDDILIHSRSEAEHRTHVRAVMATLTADSWRIAPAKCIWGVDAVEFVGFQVDARGLHVGEKKTKAITDWSTPTCAKHVRQFLGVTGFYRRFMRGYAGIAAPLYNLTEKKRESFHWTAECDWAFEALKIALCTAPVLSTPEPGNTEFVMHTDASKVAIGGVLSQWQKMGGQSTTGKLQLRPIAFFSRKLSMTEVRYAAYDRELLALKEALKNWRFFVQGNHVTIYSDHRLLKRILKQRTLSSCQFATLTELGQFDYDIRYIKGARNIVADRLSRRTDHEVDEEYITSISSCFLTETTEWLDTVKQAYENDEWMGPVKMVLEGEKQLDVTGSEAAEGRWTASQMEAARKRSHRFRLTDEGLLILREGERIAIPQGQRLRHTLFEEFHDSPLGGHFGEQRTYLALARRFFWPAMEKSVKLYVKGCDMCHRIKAQNDLPYGLLEPLDVPESRWARIGIDFITKLPRSSGGHDTVISVIDHLTKRAHFVAASEDGLTAEEFAHVFLREFVRLHGFPEKIVSDRDGRFISSFWQYLMKLTKTRLGMSSAHHPQTDGQTEKLNDIVQTYLRAYTREKPEDWDRWLALAEFAYNSSVHVSTGKSPFELDLGYIPRMPIDASLQAAITEEGENIDAMGAATFLTRQEYNLNLAKEKLRIAQDRQVAMANGKRRAHSFRVGERVYLDTRNLPLTYANVSSTLGNSRKLQDRFAGPFRIVKPSRSPNAWFLELPPTWRIQQPLNVNLFKPDTSDPQRPSFPPPLRQSMGKDGIYWLEKIVDHRTRGRGRGLRTEYRARWTGWTEEDDTWEPLTHFAEDARERIEEYHRERGLTPPQWPRRSTRRKD